MTRWVVVGAGSAGAVAAARLSEDATNDVTLLEAGADLDPTGHHGADFFGALRSPGRTHDLLVVPVDGHPPRPYVRGRGVGGSGAINAMLAPAGGPFTAAGHLLHTEVAQDHELGAVDRALLAAAPDAARVPLTRRDGRRVTVADAYVAPARTRANFRVLAHAPVDRVLLDGRRAVGVRLVDGSTWEADRVVVSAGAIHSPAILLRSGVDTPGIGEGLEDHPSAAITLELHPDAVAPVDSLAAATLLQRDGFQVLPLNHVGGSQPYGVLMAALMHVRSAGRVTLVDDDPTTQPLVEFRMLSHPDDLAGLVRAVCTAIDLPRHEAFHAIVRQAFADDDGTTIDALDTPERVAAWLPDHVGDYAHASSSCRMGTVVGDDGAVVGYEALYVCDASVFSRIPDVNPHLPTVRLAETFAARWLGRS